MHTSVTTNRICWRLTELPAVTGLSLPYWRKMTAENKLTVRRVGRAVIVMNDDLLRFLAGMDGGECVNTEAENQAECLAATA